MFVTSSFCDRLGRSHILQVYIGIAQNTEQKNTSDGPIRLRNAGCLLSVRHQLKPPKNGFHGGSRLGYADFFMCASTVAKQLTATTVDQLSSR